MAAPAGAAFAHDLEIGWSLAGSSLRIQVAYGGDAPVGGAAVAIRSAEGEAVAAGETDAGGRITLPLPRERPFWIEARHQGHRLQVKVDDPSRSPRRASYLERILRIAAGGLGILALGGLVLLALRLRRTKRHAPGN